MSPSALPYLQALRNAAANTSRRLRGYLFPRCRISWAFANALAQASRLPQNELVAACHPWQFVFRYGFIIARKRSGRAPLARPLSRSAGRNEGACAGRGNKVAIGAASALRACGRAKGRMRVVGARVMGASRGARSRPRTLRGSSRRARPRASGSRGAVCRCLRLDARIVGDVLPAFATGG